MSRRWPLAMGLFAGLAAIALGLHSGTDAADAWGRAARWTARIGLPIFLVTYLASSLGRLWPGDLTRHLQRDRRWWGLGFAACHTIHLYALIQAIEASAEPRSIASLIPGGLAYATIFAMALTSNDTAMRALGRSWKRLHRFGIHYVWLIFTLAYAKRLADPLTLPEAIYGTGLCLIAAALRFTAWRRRQQARPVTS